MHITHIIPTLSFGGAERTVVDIINRAHPDFRFSILVFSENTPLKSQITRPNVQVICVHKKGQLSLGLIGNIKKELRSLKPDVVHTHLFGGDVWGRIAARSLKIPVVTTEHNVNNDEGMIKALVKRLMKRKTKAYAACSETVREYMRSRYGIKKNVQVVYPGVDLERFNSTPAQLFVPLKVAIVGRLVAQKGHKKALQAISSLDKNLWELSIVGDGPLKLELQSWCKKYNITEKVTFVPPTSKIEQVYARHDIVLIPSQWEGLGIVAMEAMAAGRMVIASSVGGLKEIIQNKTTGILCDGEVHSFTEAMEWCVDHHLEALTIAQQASQYAHAHFGVEIMVQKYQEMYKSVV